MVVSCRVACDEGADHRKLAISRVQPEMIASDVGYPIVSKLAASTDCYLMRPVPIHLTQSTEHFNSRMFLLDSVCEEIFLVLPLLVNVVALIIYWQCRILWQNMRQTVLATSPVSSFYCCNSFTRQLISSLGHGQMLQQ